MSDDLFKKLGLSDGCSADEMKGAMAKYMADMDEKLAKYADLEEKMSKFEDEKKAEAEKMAAPFEGKESPEEEKAEDEAKEKMAKDLGLEPGAKLSKVYAAFSAKMVPMSKLAETEKRLAALEAERAAEKQAALEIKYGELADKGIAAGYSKEKRDDLIKFARADFDAAKSFVESLPGAKVLSRITSGGSPLGTVRAETAAPESPDVNGSRLPVRQASFAERARKYAKEHNLKGLEGLRQAQRAVLAQDPSAADDLF